MCGLAVLWGTDSPAAVEAMIDRQRHRGPDGTGIVRSNAPGAAFGHCRLAVIDPEGGHQPIAAHGGSAVLVANGMIYNDRELRARLGDSAYATRSDSESILHLIERHGRDAAADLDGMFAFVMQLGDRLVAARDPLGIKPLYTGRIGQTLAFASEIKALAGVADDITEFPAGHTFDTADGLKPYYALPQDGPAQWALEDALEALRDTLERAVVKRLRSDVPFGALLSGGLDSSIIAALAARHVDRLQTFAVGLPGSPDLAAARVVAEHLGTRHHELAVRPEDVRAILPRILYHLESYDRDLVRSAVPCYLVAGLAAERVKVVLTGEGADELFAGYDYYRDYEDPDLLHEELARSVSAMHDVNLQRVDRMTMAHGLEARVPFLDTEMVSLGLSLPPQWKLHTDRPGARPVEKWILRKAFEHLLPAEIVWRDKLQFDQGSGFADLLAAGAAAASGDDAGAEEQIYRDILADQYDAPGAVLDLVSHWNDVASRRQMPTA